MNRLHRGRVPDGEDPFNEIGSDRAGREDRLWRTRRGATRAAQAMPAMPSLRGSVAPVVWPVAGSRAMAW